MRRPTFTLAQLFVLTGLTIAVAVLATLYKFLEWSQQSIVEQSERLRGATAQRIGNGVSAELGGAATVLADLERAVRLNVLRVDDRSGIEASLFTELVDHPALSDVTLTHAAKRGYAPGGPAVMEDADRWQTTVYRASEDSEGPIVTRTIAGQTGAFLAEVRIRPRGGGLASGTVSQEPVAMDPTTHPTFEAAVSQELYGRTIWSDLSFSELDVALSPEKRRVVVTVQKAIEDGLGHFVGVVRVGLLMSAIDHLPRMATGDPTSPERVFLSDTQGRLVSRWDPSDRLLIGEDLRIASDHAPRAIVAALAMPELRQLTRDRPERSGRLDVDGGAYLVTFRALGNSQDWVAGIVVPEDFYTRDLRALRTRLLEAFLAALLVVLTVGGIALRQVRASLRRIVLGTTRMRQFDFVASAPNAPFRDVFEVMEGLERAKTSMRALGKYVPIDLVRQLYEANREPELGGELVELSLMFSDIEGFTTLSEKLAPDALARSLGHYLEAMTAGVRSTNGTVDKFIGDAVMAFWNAPTRHSDHARRACLAVLSCIRRTRELYASPSWAGLQPLFTRYGLHTARVMVGHFGAPERLSYTALGDGVNLASRLEALGKQYGVGVLASQAIVAATGDEFAFRFVDRVAVKGKREAIGIYELLGLRAESTDALASAKIYETALKAYFARDFRRALEIFSARTSDPPSGVLARRCETMMHHPPPNDWDGVFVATSK